MSAVSVQTLQQALSAIALTTGLLYTAYQIHQAHKSQRVANFSHLIELQFQLRKMRVDDPTLARIHPQNVTSGATDEELREYDFQLMQLSLFEIAWFNHTNGQLPNNYFKSWQVQMKAIAAEPSFRKMWASEAPKIMHDEFRRYVDELVPPAAT